MLILAQATERSIFTIMVPMPGTGGSINVEVLAAGLACLFTAAALVLVILLAGAQGHRRAAG
jgi:hypothetical protein